MLNNYELDEYCQKFYKDVYKYCFYFLGNEADAEDATQETFVIFSQKGHLIDEDHIKVWLLRTAHHMVLREYTRRYKKMDNECEYDEMLLEASRRFTRFEEDMISYYGERFIKEVYERLTDSEKECFELYSDGTIKTGQIALLLGIEPHACSMRKKRMIEKCREILKEIIFF